MTVYKLVRRGGWSACVWYRVGWRPVRYSIGKVSRPRKGNGPLACFDTQFSAQSFLWAMNFEARHYYILRCEGLPSEEKSLWQYHGGKRQVADAFPTGTILCDRVTPLERIK